MMRIGFLPSDFNPMVLMLGEPEDFRALGGVLRSFARDGADVQIDTLGFCAPGQTRLRLTAESGSPGVHRDGDDIIWRVTPDAALGFASLADALAEPGRLAGSEMLACSTQEEIPVKLSRGEYTADFLLPP